jgi:hypothetical protein
VLRARTRRPAHTTALPNARRRPHQDDKLGRLLSGSLSQNYDAVIGSLPKGLSTDERLRIRQSAPMSPALGALQALPSVSCVQARGRRRARLAAPSRAAACACVRS